MIKYTLKCAVGHSFEAWFGNAAQYDEQRGAGHLSCPVCGEARVEKALMAPNVRTTDRHLVPTEPPSASDEAATGEQMPAAPSPAEPVALPPSTAMMASADLRKRAMLESLLKLRAYVETNSEHVGTSFAEEARAIHEGEAEARAIHGQATPEEAEALHDDGIDAIAIPWVDIPKDS
ncbi:MAG: DUF1178 family protein [Pseudomonadota bacterium]